MPEIKKRRAKLKVLPTLPEEYDMAFYVDSKTINLHLLEKSKYKLLHRPYFAMKGSTHSAYTLNPHTKIGVDAAPANCEFISFKEFLKIFRK